MIHLTEFLFLILIQHSNFSLIYFLFLVISFVYEHKMGTGKYFR